MLAGPFSKNRSSTSATPDAEPGLFQAIRDNGTKSILAMPLLREGAVIGSIALNAMEPGGFSDSQVALLQTFAEQAVIAIGSAETYRELQARTAALARAQQRIRRADRTPIGHHRRAEGDVGLAG